MRLSTYRDRFKGVSRAKSEQLAGKKKNRRKPANFSMATKIWFGVHTGTKLKNLPPAYLNYLAGQRHNWTQHRAKALCWFIFNQQSPVHPQARATKPGNDSLSPPA